MQLWFYVMHITPLKECNLDYVCLYVYVNSRFSNTY